MPPEFDQPQQIEPPKSSKITNWIFIIIGFLLIGLGGYFLYQYLTTPFINPNQESPSAIQQADISNWKTYRNEEYGFEIKYPTYLLLDEVTLDSKTNFYNDYVSIDIDTPENITESKKPNPGSGGNLPFFRFGAFNPINKETITPCSVMLKKLVVGGMSVSVCEEEDMSGSMMRISFIKDKIVFSAQSGSYSNANTQLIDQILSTFKFISTSTPMSYEDLVKNLPPDPGEEGKKTLEGIDSDGDGVRDDVQKIISLKYKHSLKVIEAARDGAKALQAAILASQKPNNGGLSLSISSMERKAAQCILFIDPENASSIITEIVATVLNTEARFDAYNLYKIQIKGQSDSSPAPSPEDKKLSCSFNPALLPN